MQSVTIVVRCVNKILTFEKYTRDTSMHELPLCRTVVRVRAIRVKCLFLVCGERITKRQTWPITTGAGTITISSLILRDSTDKRENVR